MITIAMCFVIPNGKIYFKKEKNFSIKSEKRNVFVARFHAKILILF